MCAGPMQMCAQNALKAALIRLKSALIHAFTLLLCVGFVLFCGLAGLCSDPQLNYGSFCSLLAGDSPSFSRHIDPSILQVCTFFLWSEPLTRRGAFVVGKATAPGLELSSSGERLEKSHCRNFEWDSSACAWCFLSYAWFPRVLDRRPRPLHR